MALGYALVLAATSNDFSQRRLGRGWRFLQRQAYTLFVLSWLHTAGWLLFSYPHSPGFIPWFLTFTTVAVVAQTERQERKLLGAAHNGTYACSIMPVMGEG